EQGKKRSCKRGRSIVAVMGVFLFAIFVASASAQNFGYTSVCAPPDGEANHATILSGIYGGTFTKQTSPLSGLLVDYSNGTITARRAYDHDDEAVSLNLLTQTLDGEVDQIWTDGQATITAKAKYASLNQSFGWNGGGTGIAYEQLLSDANVGQEGVTFNVDEDFLWGHKPDGYQWWSLEENNSDCKDHFITYKIEGLGGPDVVWLLFMEDLPLSQADRDYNDFVVEISAIPEPATIALLAFGSLLLRKRNSNK
ncbi:MAG: PEP-CTERM sorting domain-containing protein, partial [Sedimentisphaerales bacterium]